MSANCCSAAIDLATSGFCKSTAAAFAVNARLSEALSYAQHTEVVMEGRGSPGPKVRVVKGVVGSR